MQSVTFENKRSVVETTYSAINFVIKSKNLFLSKYKLHIIIFFLFIFYLDIFCSFIILYCYNSLIIRCQNLKHVQNQLAIKIKRVQNPPSQIRDLLTDRG